MPPKNKYKPFQKMLVFRKDIEKKLFQKIQEKAAKEGRTVLSQIIWDLMSIYFPTEIAPASNMVVPQSSGTHETLTY